MELLLHAHLHDLIIGGGGVLVGILSIVATRFSLPFSGSILRGLSLFFLMLRMYRMFGPMAKHYFATNPKGQQIAAATNLDEKVALLTAEETGAEG